MRVVNLYRPLIVTFALSKAVSEIFQFLYTENDFYHTPLQFRLKFGTLPFGVNP